MRSSITIVGAMNETNCSKNSTSSQDVEAAVLNVMRGARSIKVRPMLSVPFKIIIEAPNSGIICYIIMFTGQKSSRFEPVSQNIACRTNTAMAVELHESKLHFVSSYFANEVCQKHLFKPACPRLQNGAAL